MVVFGELDKKDQNVDMEGVYMVSFRGRKYRFRNDGCKSTDSRRFDRGGAWTQGLRRMGIVGLLWLATEN